MMLLPLAPMQRYVTAKRPGYVVGLDAYEIGVGSTILGAGRSRAADHIDHAAGVQILAPVGTLVREGDPILEIHFSDPDKLLVAMPRFEASLKIDDAISSLDDLIVEEVV